MRLLVLGLLVGFTHGLSNIYLTGGWSAVFMALKIMVSPPALLLYTGLAFIIFLFEYQLEKEL